MADRNPDDIQVKYPDNVVIMVARTAYEVNRNLNHYFGEDVNVAWSDVPDDQRNDTIFAIKTVMQTPNTTEAQIHQLWMDSMLARGWRYGEIKDPVKRLHPDLKAYIELDDKAKLKSTMFLAVVRGVCDM